MKGKLEYVGEYLCDKKWNGKGYDENGNIIYELESKLEVLKRKNKDKEKEYNNNLDNEIQKYQKMENSYMNLIQEKDDKISILEMQLSHLSNKTSQNKNELSKENIKLMQEIKRDHI